MNTLDAIVSFDKRAPKGWKQNVGVAEYEQLDDRQKYYEPLYAKYRTKKIRDYDPDYGNFVGWKPIQVGLGEPISYRYVGYFEARVIDQLLSSNVLMQRVMNSAKWSK